MREERLPGALLILIAADGQDARLHLFNGRGDRHPTRGYLPDLQTH